ncbi:MAG: hypothetical protein IPJ71_01745 [Bdellovibrionales bacterium]|nr:hypothetical protein [Bdellovibrionales bacterium]
MKKSVVASFLLSSLLPLAVMIPSGVWAQNDTRHPRVAELEDQYKRQAMDFLKSRFPHLPFSVVVSIDPLRRVSADNYQAKQEALPYYLLQDEEIRDEWDDPNATLYVLSRRIKSVQVSVSVPSSVADEELSEIKETLISSLRLVPARDKIEILKRSWSGLPNFSVYAGIGLAAILIFLLGLYAITRMSLRRMTRSFSELQTSLGSKNSQASVSPPPVVSMADENKNSGMGGGEFRFTDPIKIREVIAGRVHELLYSDEFPRLEDIVNLDRFAQNDSRSTGALISEFPLDMQRRLFSLGRGEYWMEAFIEPGELVPQCLEILERLCRVQKSKRGKEWEALLIQIWRMDELTRVRFLRTIEQEESMAIVHSMPKNVSVPTARQAFPGSWGAVLDPQFRPTKVTVERIKKIGEKAMEILPPVPFEILETYRQEKDLIAYLNVSDVAAERDIYRASPETAMIHRIRPPFYRVVQDDKAHMEQFVNMISLDDWALALFNVNRSERANIDRHFSNKQKFIFIEKLKALDSRNPELRQIGLIRERIARSYAEYMKGLSLNQKAVDVERAQENEPDSQVESDNEQNDSGDTEENVA